MQKQINYLTTIILAVLFTACDKGSDPEYIRPDVYLPAYPGSYWDYSDGSRIRATNYELHSYRTSTQSTQYSNESYVPIWDGKYLYKYSIYQPSPLYPMKQLLKASGTSTWIVDENNGVKVKRSEQHIDSLMVDNKLFTDIYQVTEFLETLDNTDNWNIREYYAKNVGLIKVEVNNPTDKQNSIVLKEIREYFINK